MRLRGYDEYEVTLGDEMRGERASLGKTLLDAEFDLRIKADVIRAIEDCDLDGFPNDSVVAGYVRSYARYLGLDRDDCYRRFCAESGFRSPVSALGGLEQPAQSGGGLHNIVAAPAALGSGLTQSRFAVRSAPARLSARINLGGLTSALAMLGLIAGLGYGGYALLQDIQRVGFAPLPEAPEVVSEAPLISAPLVEGGLLRRPDANAYQGGGVLAAELLRADLVDRLAWFRAPLLFGGDGVPVAAAFGVDALSDAPAFARSAVVEAGPDMVETYCRET